MKKLLAGLMLALCAVGAQAQFLSGQVLTAASLNAAFLGISGGTLTGPLTAPSATITGNFSVGTANPSLKFNIDSGVAADRQLLAYLQENPISVLDFGADPTGTFDSASAIRAAINYACASPSQKIVYEPPGVYLWGSTVTLSCNGVKLVGAGSGGINDAAPTITAPTINRWIGPAGGTALLVAPSSNLPLYSVGVLGIFWDGNNSLGGIAVDLMSVKYSDFEIRAMHWTTSFVQMDISSGVTVNADNTGNIFYRIAGYQSSATDGSFLVTHASTSHNSCWNTFVLIQGNWDATPFIILNGDDNEMFMTTNGYNPNVNTTVKGVVLNGGATFFQTTRHLTFYNLSTTANGGGGVFAQGTDQATFAVTGINIAFYDSDNNQADPVVGPGAQLWFGRNGAPIGKQAFYWASSPNGYVETDSSGKIKIAAVVAVANGATSGSYTFPTFPNQASAGFPTSVASVSATASTTPVTFSAFASQTQITITLPSAATQTMYFYVIVEGH